MNRRIIYERLDGGVDIVTPCRCIEDKHLSDDEIFQRAWDKLPKNAINPQIVDAEIIPADRTFRNAWKHGGDKVQVNMDMAREIHLGRIREARNAALAFLDVETMKAVGKGDDAARDAVEVQKQTLRDIPQVLDLTVAKTPEELKEIWPEELK